MRAAAARSCNRVVMDLSCRFFAALLVPGLLGLGGVACGGGRGDNPRDAGPDDVAVSPDADAGLGPDGDAGAPHGYALDSFAGGFDFRLTLPPDFSRFLPLTGDEVTREPPGFHDQTSPEYFSYEFLWWLTDSPDLSTSALRSDLMLYFTGLCASSTVAVTIDEPLPATGGGDADAGAGVLLARRAGTLTAGDCFNAPVPAATLEVSTYRCPDHDAVITIVSPQPNPGPVWTELNTIRDSFSCW